ncbi:EscU/YscU/HrcU family type III secretion system export apparatus switch protein [Ectothiorhodospiraceae bacterium WFHF3C12]|nr:EscU/YscU/HrcU family type III secretion system export apparatus switch protein [Ectothiorhodospiraceae bacterium WFHF3C12]
MSRRKRDGQTYEHDQRMAVALAYSGEGAPRVTAKGAEALAEQIIAVAEENDIPLRADRQLVQVLAQVELGEEIPEPLYRVVAEVIAFAYLIKGKFPEGFDPGQTGGGE